MRHLIVIAALLPFTAHAQAVYMGNISGTLTTGGTAQNATGFNPNRRGCVIQNNSTGDLWINDLGTAAATQPSIRVPAGAQYACGSPGSPLAPNGALSVFGATTGQTWSGREW